MPASSRDLQLLSWSECAMSTISLWLQHDFLGQKEMPFPSTSNTPASQTKTSCPQVPGTDTPSVSLGGSQRSFTRHPPGSAPSQTGIHMRSHLHLSIFARVLSVNPRLETTVLLSLYREKQNECPRDELHRNLGVVKGTVLIIL